jgi:hypothetical protein
LKTLQTKIHLEIPTDTFLSFDNINAYREACLQHRYEIYNMNSGCSMFVDQLPPKDSEYYNPKNFLIHDRFSKE